MVSLSLLRLFGYYVFYDCRCFRLRVFVRLFSAFRDMLQPVRSSHTLGTFQPSCQ